MKSKCMSLCVICLSLFLISSCSVNPGTALEEEPAAKAKEASYTIAVLIPGDVSFFGATKIGMDDAAKDLGVELIYEDASWNPMTQEEQAEAYLDGSVDLIALCAADAKAATAIVEKASEAGVPIIAFTNAIGDDESHYYPGLVCYVGQNEVKTGEMLAEIAITLLNGTKGRCIEIHGVNGTFPQIYRQKGFHQGIEDSGINIISANTSNWSEEEAYRYISQQILSGGRFNLVVCQDDNSAIGAGRALVENGLKEDVYVVGMGGSIDGLQAIRDGIIDGTAFLSAIEEGRVTIETAVAYLRGEAVPEVIDIPQYMVTYQNLDSFQGEW